MQIGNPVRRRRRTQVRIRRRPAGSGFQTHVMVSRQGPPGVGAAVADASAPREQAR
jgi:hypothetical protein